MSLSSENIQFIDNYLKNSEVIYYDIRMEILDHVATAVEQKMEVENLDFYDAFKSYMVVNKKEILKGNKEEGLHFREPLKKFGLFVIQPLQLFLAFIMYLTVYFFTQYFGINDFTKYIYITLIITYLIFGLIHFLLTRKKKFYYIDKNFSIIFLLYQIANPLHITANERFISSVIFNSILLFVFFAFLRFYYLEMKSFRQKNQFLFQ
ncbi:hypothetical protein [Flavobacterium sp.]|uniref:hypothetical protein n=1 Tax=Flavobacterium sp. TaxID=239 RepID=UPI0040482EDF